jgi:transcriptional regulator with XRE-family HTH domain
VVLGSFLAEVRKVRGLTQQELAEISGIPQPNLSAFERDRRVPSAASLHRIIHACGFVLSAAAGTSVVRARPPIGDDPLDQLIDDLIDAPRAEPPQLSAEQHAEQLVAVLDLASEIVRSRGTRS